MMKNNHQPLIMEITVISAQGLKNTCPSISTLFSKRLRPFVVLATVPPYQTKPATAIGDKPSRVYQSRVDDKGGVNPMWNDTFHVPIGVTTTNNFMYQRQQQCSPCVYLQLYTRNVMVGPTQLGWCQIPVADLLDGFSPAGGFRHLSYRLRGRDGSRGQGVVNVRVRLEGLIPMGCPQRPLNYDVTTHLPEMSSGRTVIGIPVTMLPAGGW